MPETLVPPHSIEAEHSLLGAVMLKPDLIGDLMGELDPSDFYQPTSQTVFATMIDLHLAGLPVDVVTMADALHGQVDATFLLEAQNATPSISHAKRYADIIIDNSRRRQGIQHCANVQAQFYESGNDLDDVVASLDPDNVPLLRSRGGEVRNVMPIGEWMDIADQAEATRPWLVPHVFRPRWRSILVSGEGVGKATLMRQLGLHAACGIDPFDASRRIDPVRVLYVDMENPMSTIRLQCRLANKSLDLARMAGENYVLWHEEAGLNMRSRTVKLNFERILQRHRPQIVFAGPLYKMFRRRSNEDMEQVAIEFCEIMDDLRVRYDFALMLEHHVPKGQNGAMRDMIPFGSSAFLRWPEFGLAMNDHGEAKFRPSSLTAEMDRFRGDREPADWPDELTRGGMTSSLAWQPRYANGRGTAIGARWQGGQWTYPDPDGV